MKYEEKIVAFIDILGFKNLVNEETNIETVEATLRMPYNFRKDDMAKQLKITGVMMTSISDSIVFSIKRKEKNAMNKIMRIVSAFAQTLLLKNGLLLRGGIVVGKIYHDNEIVFGPGLVKAYELESQIAIFPRIVMKTSDFEQAILSCTETSQYIWRKVFVKNEDNLLSLDIFRHMDQKRLDLCYGWLEQMKVSDLRIQQKIDWLKTTIDQKRSFL